MCYLVSVHVLSGSLSLLCAIKLVLCWKIARTWQMGWSRRLEKSFLRLFLFQKSALTFPDFCSSRSLRPNSQVLSHKVKNLDSKKKLFIFSICFLNHIPFLSIPRKSSKGSKKRNRLRCEGLPLAPKKFKNYRKNSQFSRHFYRIVFPIVFYLVFPLL